MPTQPAPGTIEAPAPLTGPEIAREVGHVLTGLCAVIAAAFDRHPIFVYILNDLWTRLNRAKQRFTRVMDNLHAGRKPRPSRPGTAAGAVGGMPPAKLPNGYGWLIRAIPYKAAAYLCLLEHIFARPGVEDLIKSSPEAQRILRPICHMLGMKPAFLARPRTPRAKKPEAPAPITPQKPRKPRPPPDPALARHMAWLETIRPRTNFYDSHVWRPDSLVRKFRES